MNATRHSITATLALSGVALWTLGASRLSASGEFNFEPNPLGVKESAYGQVIALAAQSKIDEDWHGVETAGNSRICPDCGKIHGANVACAKPDSNSSLLARLDDAVSERAAGKQNTGGLKFYLRRQIEDRLRLAYQFDPSNYTNYNAYHFFLTEPELGTRKTLNTRVLDLARKTTAYCMREDHDPRPALTAASAAGNILLLMFDHKEDYTLDQMREQLGLMDQAIDRSATLTGRWVDTSDFQNLSPARQGEMNDRITLIKKTREAAAGAIQRLSSTPQASR